MRRVIKPHKEFCSLTGPQWELLCEIVDGKRKSAASYYRPRVMLQDLGLIREYGVSGNLIATDEGKALVESVRAKIVEAKCAE